MIRRQLQRWLPSADKLHGSRSLRWLGPLLRRHWLWHPTRRRVAAGAAVGVFFGFLVPVMQIAAAALAAVVLRANLPVAAAATLVSNPLTYVPIWVAAYRTGTALTGEPANEAAARAQAQAMADAATDPLQVSEAAAVRNWRQRMADIGKPLMLGLLVFAVAGAALTWLGVHLVWAAAVALRRRRRRRRAARQPDGGG